jgi:hypothetical protein
VAPMAGESQPSRAVSPDEVPPATYSRPTDPPPALTPVRASSPQVELHQAWQQSASTTPGATPSATLGHQARRLVNRGLGRTDRELIAQLIRAVDTVAARCDELSDRLASQQVLLDEVATALTEEVTAIRAKLARAGEADA